MAEDRYRFHAVVRPQKAEALVRQLLACAGVSACHAVEVRGSGRQERHLGRQVLGFLPKVSVVGLVSDAGLSELEAAVQTVCPTGRSGDGKLFLEPVLRSIPLGAEETDV